MSDGKIAEADVIRQCLERGLPKGPDAPADVTTEGSDE